VRSVYHDVCQVSLFVISCGEALSLTDFRSGFVDMSLTYYLPQYFQAVLGYGPIGAGIFLIPVLVSQMVLSWISVGP